MSTHNVILFPAKRIVRTREEQVKLREKLKPPPPVTTYRELYGSRPKGHPILGRTKRGKAMLAAGQVWVDLHDDKLWVLTDFRKVRESGYPHNVVLVEYNGTWRRELSESGLRGNMKVWDDMRKFLGGIYAKLHSET